MPCVVQAAAELELPPLLDRSVLFTRAAAYGPVTAGGVPLYVRPSHRIGSHFSPQAGRAAAVLASAAGAPGDSRPPMVSTHGAAELGAALAAFLRAFPDKACLVQARRPLAGVETVCNASQAARITGTAAIVACSMQATADCHFWQARAA